MIYGSRYLFLVSAFVFCILFNSSLKADSINLNVSPYDLGPATPLSNAANQHLLKWLPLEKPAQHQVFEYLYKKAGGFKKANSVASAHTEQGPVIVKKAGFDSCPIDFDLLPQWFSIYYQSSIQDSKTQYGLVYSNLLLAHDLLKQQNKQQKMLGLRIAYYCNVWVARQLKDNWLSAKINDAFILPHLDMAYTQSWRDVNQEQIMNEAIQAYEKNKEQGKQIAALMTLENYPASPQTADRARLSLAGISSLQGHYASSIGYLKAIKTPDLKNNDAYIEKMKKKQQEAEATDELKQKKHNKKKRMNY